MRRIGWALLVAALVWVLAHVLDLVIGFVPGYGRWVGAVMAFLAVLWIKRKVV